MAAAAASDRRRGGRDGEKKRPGGKVGTEPFDPADHVIKEKADAASMWLVIVIIRDLWFIDGIHLLRISYE